MTTTFCRIDLRCPNCAFEFASTTARSDAIVCRQRTDFRVDGPTAELLGFGVHVCARCGYAGAAESFGDLEELSYEVQRKVWDELAPRLSTTDMTPAEKYESAAKVAGWGQADDVHVGDLWLRAAWCCVDSGDVEAERFYRRHAAWSFERALERYDEISPSERAKVTYLVGELWRRIGDVARANVWFNRVESEVTSPGEQHWLVVLARDQQDDPAEWFV